MNLLLDDFCNSCGYARNESCLSLLYPAINDNLELERGGRNGDDGNEMEVDVEEGDGEEVVDDEEEDFLKSMYGNDWGWLESDRSLGFWVEKKVLGEVEDGVVREALEAEWKDRTRVWDDTYHAAWDLICGRRMGTDERDETDWRRDDSDDMVED